MRRAARRPGLVAASAERGAVRSAGRVPGSAAEMSAGPSRAPSAGTSAASDGPARRRLRIWARRPALWLSGVLSVGALAGIC